MGELLRVVKVLVVEDFEEFRQLTCSLLRERAECRVVGEAADGLEAVQKVEELRPDLILLDVGLPKLNGIKVAERARKIVPDAKLLFISQESSSDVIDETFRVGGHGYVLKERTGSDLLPAIEAVLRGEQFVSSTLKAHKLTDTSGQKAPHRMDVESLSSQKGPKISLNAARTLPGSCLRRTSGSPVMRLNPECALFPPAAE